MMVYEASSKTDFQAASYLQVNSCGYEDIIGFDYAVVRSDGRNDYHLLYVQIGREHFRKHIAERPYIFGFFQWIAFEHRGEAIWPRICSQAGAIDLFMQKKDAFYQNQSH